MKFTHTQTQIINTCSGKEEERVRRGESRRHNAYPQDWRAWVARQEGLLSAHRSRWRDRQVGMWCSQSRTAGTHRRASRSAEEIQVRSTPRSSAGSQKGQQSNASTLQGRMIPKRELHIEPNCQSCVRDEIQFPNTRDFRHSLPRYPFLRTIHESGDPQGRREGKTQNDN